MDTASAQADPVFWLHHANTDRLWSRWQADHPKTKTPHTATVPHLAPLFGVKVASQLDIATLGYSYA